MSIPCRIHAPPREKMYYFPNSPLATSLASLHLPTVDAPFLKASFPIPDTRDIYLHPYRHCDWDVPLRYAHDLGPLQNEQWSHTFAASSSNILDQILAILQLACTTSTICNTILYNKNKGNTRQPMEGHSPQDAITDPKSTTKTSAWQRVISERVSHAIWSKIVSFNK
jgi:hypothetical protein